MVMRRVSRIICVCVHARARTFRQMANLDALREGNPEGAKELVDTCEYMVRNGAQSESVAKRKRSEANASTTKTHRVVFLPQTP